MSEPRSPGDPSVSIGKARRAWRRAPAAGPLQGRWTLLLSGFVALAVLLVLYRLASGLEERGRVVVAYVAQDQVYAEPIFALFEKQTGIKVRALYDSEAVKTVGLANRLLAERSHPQADLFWGNEELRTRQLAREGVFREDQGCAAFGYRSRRVIYNVDRVAPHQVPRSLLDLTNDFWRGKVALAYPMFGSTSTHFLALRDVWGEPRWLQWCRDLHANQPMVVDGNSMVARLVADGRAAVGLTDSDDFAVVKRQGAPVEILPWTQETLLIPNTVGLVRKAPHPAAAEALFRFLQTPEIANQLVHLGALEGATAAGPEPEVLRPNWNAVLLEMDTANARLQEVFLR